MSRPYTLHDVLRAYDQCLYDWLDGLKVDYGDVEGVPRPKMGILRVFAAPNRAFALMEKLLVRKGWLPTPLTVITPTAHELEEGAVYEDSSHVQVRVRSSSENGLSHLMLLLEPKRYPVAGTWTRVSGTGDATISVSSSTTTVDPWLEDIRMFENPAVPTPFASIQRLDPTLDPTRSNNLGSIPILDADYPGSGEFSYFRVPNTWDIQYLIDFWAQKQYTDVNLREWIIGQVGHMGAGPNERMMVVKFGGLWGNKLAPFRIDSISDNSDLESLVDEERFFRVSIAGTMKAHVWNQPVARSKAILQVGFDWSEPPEDYDPTPQILETTRYYGNLVRKGDLSNATASEHTKVISVGVLNHPEYATLVKKRPDLKCYQLLVTNSADTLTTEMLPTKEGMVLIRGDVYLNNGTLRLTLNSRAGVMLSRFTIGGSGTGWYRFERFVRVPANVDFEVAGAQLVLNMQSGTYCVLYGLEVLGLNSAMGAEFWNMGDISTGPLAVGASTQETLELPEGVGLCLFSGLVGSATSSFEIKVWASANPTATANTYVYASNGSSIVVPVDALKGPEVVVRVKNVGNASGAMAMTGVSLRPHLRPLVGNATPADWRVSS